jgi:hypothetical protein
VERHPLGADTKDLGVRPRGIAQGESRCANLFCFNLQPQSGIGGDVEVIDRHKNLWDFLEGFFELHDVLEVPLSFTIFEGVKGAIIFWNNVIASLDMHWIVSIPGKCNPTSKLSQATSRPTSGRAAVEALALAEMECEQREMFGNRRSAN